MTALKNLSLTAIATAIWLVIAWAGYALFIDDNEMTVQESGARAVTGKAHSTFRAGDVFVARRVICTKFPAPGDFSIEIHGGEKNTVYVVSRGRLGQVPAGCNERNVTTRIPDGLPPGKYQLRAFVVHEINPLRSIRRELPPIPFEVIP